MFSGADDVEATPETIAGGDSEIDALVVDELTRGEVVVAGTTGEVTSLNVDGRVDDGRVAAIKLADACGDVVRICDEIIDATSGCSVPQAKIVSGKDEGRTSEEAEASGALVAMIEIPEITHGRVAIADVAGVRGGEDAFRGARFGTDDQIVAAEIELLERERVKRKEMAVPAAATRNPLQERSLNGTATEGIGKLLGIDDHREEIGSREHGSDGFDDAFAAAIGDKPVMDDGDAGIREGGNRVCGASSRGNKRFGLDSGEAHLVTFAARCATRRT